MDTRRVHNRRKPSAKTPEDKKKEVTDVPEESIAKSTMILSPTMKLPVSDQIWYHWLFAIEFEEPIHHAILPFSEPIAQEMNN